MNLDDFSWENRIRCEAPDGFNHALDEWSLSDWMTATMGELGEAANIAKKLNRVRDGIPGNTETPEALREALADEIADTFIYLDLLAQSQGLRLSEIVRSKFDRTSAKICYAAPTPIPAGYVPGTRETEDRIAELLDANNREVERRRAFAAMLRTACRQFRTYQAHHLAKDTPEAHEKARVNGDLANAIEALLAAPAEIA